MCLITALMAMCFFGFIMIYVRYVIDNNCHTLPCEAFARNSVLDYPICGVTFPTLNLTCSNVLCTYHIFDGLNFETGQTKNATCYWTGSIESCSIRNSVTFLKMRICNQRGLETFTHDELPIYTLLFLLIVALPTWCVICNRKMKDSTPLYVGYTIL